MFTCIVFYNCFVSKLLTDTAGDQVILQQWNLSDHRTGAAMFTEVKPTIVLPLARGHARILAAALVMTGSLPRRKRLCRSTPMPERQWILI